MIKKLLFTIVFPVLFSPLFAQTYITNVTIADVEKQKLVSNQTVVITNDLISKIQSGKIKIPANATVIDGKGKFLFPGLTDAHVHFFQNGGLYTRPDVINLRSEFPYEKEMKLAHETMEDKLRRYLQNGITNVIDVGASYSYLKQRESFKNKDFAPSIYMTGPLLTTYEPKAYENLKDEEPFSLVKNIDDGIKMVQEQLPHHPDFIKIWYIAGADGLETEASARKNLPIIKAIIEEAHKNNLKVAVHATERITAQLAVENGCDFLVHSVEDEIIKDDFVQLLKKNKTILCPTLVVYNGYENTFGQKLQMSNHELQTANPFQLGSLLDLKHLSDTLLVNKYKRRMDSEKEIARINKVNAITSENLKKLSDAGVLIATGTDAGNIGTLHASSYLNELMAMQKSGMSTWKIIEASTINGAKILNKENEFGTISVGKKANLILLDANPVDNIENLSKISRVINKGVVFNPESIIEETPIALVQRQLNAYNFRNIDAFLEPYAEDVEIYTYPDKLIEKGKAQMRKNYAAMFDKFPNLHCELIGRIVQGNIVIDKERVQFGKKIVEAVAIYHIEKNKIKKVYFVD
ncbi:amidohydrolase family protein [Flavobacterium sp. MDT1-60]|uniref:amidohydrolase family protein n=1 Tax=Flavobacterium sp. MDT1-60 TaxID=1979344 RepID=UPI00177FF4F1|nr:amidohydrolase family protein [Flavobacterium sp. MDT1-60]QOG00942.1 amidohydrolase family protein [Flavobacterium sp. MDT1-60]